MFAVLLMFQAEYLGLSFIFLLFIGIALLVIAWKTIKIVPQSTVLLIERFGKFHRIAQSGMNIIVPFLNRHAPSIGQTSVPARRSSICASSLSTFRRNR